MGNISYTLWPERITIKQFCGFKNDIYGLRRRREKETSIRGGMTS